jgi:hypothetical protein
MLEERDRRGTLLNPGLIAVREKRPGIAIPGIERLSCSTIKTGLHNKCGLMMIGRVNTYYAVSSLFIRIPSWFLHPDASFPLRALRASVVKYPCNLYV